MGNTTLKDLYNLIKIYSLHTFERENKVGEMGYGKEAVGGKVNLKFAKAAVIRSAPNLAQLISSFGRFDQMMMKKSNDRRCMFVCSVGDDMLR